MSGQKRVEKTPQLGYTIKSGGGFATTLTALDATELRQYPHNNSRIGVLQEETPRMNKHIQTIRDKHCSRWGGIPQSKLTYANRLHIGILVSAFRTGVYNLPINWKAIEFGSDTWTKFVCSNDLSTCDFDHLTRLVIAAHDNCVRVSITPCNMRNLSIQMWSRTRRENSMSSVHPTIESAIAEFRKYGAAI